MSLNLISKTSSFKAERCRSGAGLYGDYLEIDVHMTKHWSSDNNQNSYPAAPTSEGSALFSLNELRAKAEAAARVNNPMKRDDNSGLIDLKAMMAQAEQENAAEAASALHVTSHLAVYPFGAPASQPQPAIAQSVPEDESPRALRRPRRGRTASIGIAAALLSIAAIAVAAVSGGLGAFEVPRQALASPVPTALQWAMTPSEMAPASPESAELARAQPSPSEKATDTTLATPRPPKEIPHIAKAPVLNRTAEAPAASPKAPTATPPASDPCKGDLMCAMQRAVKK
jgi:hypothetical protein